MQNLPKNTVKICDEGTSAPCPFIYGIKCCADSEKEEEILQFFRTLRLTQYKSTGCAKLEKALAKL